MSRRATDGAPRAAAFLAALALVRFAAPPPAEIAACEKLRFDATRAGLTAAVCGSGAGGSSAEQVRGAARLLFGLRLDPHREEPRALEALPGVGPARALAIANEARVRPFCRPEDLERVAGIGPSIRSGLAAWVETGSRGCRE